MSSEIELPACECGSTDVSIGYESPQGYWVECGDCGYQTDKSHLRELVIAWWDKRAAPVVERQCSEVDPQCSEQLRIQALAPELAELQALSVTNIMLDVVPGDGDGHEVYAKSVSDVEDALTKLYDESEELQATIARLTADVETMRNKNNELNDTVSRLKGGQGEAVAYRWRVKGHDNWTASVCKVEFDALANDDRFVAQKLYTSQPAPVSVVFPIREISPNDDKSFCLNHDFDWHDGWNACLDKVKELNS
jgi:hypothetical protein